MSADVVYSQGFELRCNGQYRQARELFEKALAMEPGHVASRWQLALIHGFEGDFDASLKALQALHEEHPEHQDVLNDLGMTYMMLGHADEACACFRKLVMVNPDHENALRQLPYCS
jgi:tetratricopeptide (TPR) repeat protein